VKYEYQARRMGTSLQLYREQMRMLRHERDATPCPRKSYIFNILYI